MLNRTLNRMWRSMWTRTYNYCMLNRSYYSRGSTWKGTYYHKLNQRMWNRMLNPKWT